MIIDFRVRAPFPAYAASPLFTHLDAVERDTRTRVDAPSPASARAFSLDLLLREADEAGVVGASPEGAVTTVLSAAVASVAEAARGERVMHASAVIDAPRQWRRRMLILFMVTPRWWGMPQS